MPAAVERCIGCGAIVPVVEGPIHRYMTAAPGCWAAHGALSARLLSDPTAGTYRQLFVDAYAVQHPGTPGPQATQSVGAHLVSLYAQLELGLPASRAMDFLERGIRQKGFFTWLTPPSFDGALTVACMLDDGIDHAERARAWSASAWRAWADHHAQVRRWHEALAGRR